MIHFSKQLEYNLEWHHGHVKRCKDDRQQWSTQEVANVEMEELAGRAWDEVYNSVKPHLVAPHYQYYKAVQTILSDGSISGDLARTIPEAISVRRDKPKLHATLKMDTERMILIGEEITASNTRKFRKSWVARAHFSEQNTHQWHTVERAHKFVDRIPAMCRCCDDREDESILHIQRCFSRKEVSIDNKLIFKKQMREIEAPNHLLHLFEAFEIRPAIEPSAVIT